MSEVDAFAVVPGSFLDALGLEFAPIAGNAMDCVVRAHLEVGERHHTPWGVVHGGVWASAIESAASVGASFVVSSRGQFAVGVDNVTDFLRPVVSGRLGVVATPSQIGRSLQLWEVAISDVAGKVVARGRVRLANQDLPGRG